MTRLTAHRRWALMTFGPAGLALGIAGTYALARDWHPAGLWALWSLTSWAMGNASLNNYRAGYWRGRVEEGSEGVELHVRKLVSGWQPNPWDDGRW